MNAALVLDFGGVISRTLFETHASSEAALGLAPGTLTWQGPFAPETDPLWQSMQAGLISERDYWLRRANEVGHLVGESWDRMEIMVQRCRGDDVESVLRPEALQAIEQARALGAKLAVLSNELDMFYGAGFAKRLPLLRDFDVVVDATYTGILKPDPRAYEAVQLALDLPAHACVFLDDQAKNIRGALSAGWQAIELDVRHPALAYDQAIERLNAMRSI